jgi:AcrR family transcriptional regulator
MIPERGGTAGRPRVSSRRTIEEAAAELFLEQGYDRTTVDDIARRAGVGRATFFNYFPSKPDLLWVDVDEALDALRGELASSAGELSSVVAALRAIASRLGPERIPLVVTQLDLIGGRQEVTAAGLSRIATLASLLCATLARPGADPLVVDTAGAALAAATVSAWRAWAAGGVGRGQLGHYLERSLAIVTEGLRLDLTN